MRAHGILLSHQGFSIKRIAAVYQVSSQAVSAWLERWQQAGLVGLYAPPLGTSAASARSRTTTGGTLCPRVPQRVKAVGQRLEQAMHKRVSSKTIKRLLKKTPGVETAQKDFADVP
jgi:transposase